MIFPREEDAKTSPPDNVMVYCFNCYQVFTISFLATNSYLMIIEKLVDKIYSYKNQHRDVGYNLYIFKST